MIFGMQRQSILENDLSFDSSFLLLNSQFFLNAVPVMQNRHTKTELLARVREEVRFSIGLDLSTTDDQHLERKIAAVCTRLGYDSLGSCLSRFAGEHLNKKEIEVLASHLTVGETYFFRDRKLINALRLGVLPEIIREREKTTRTIRIWSAGCCSGEEPYTIAMLLISLLPDWKTWNITILATDINTDFLSRALRGRYSKWSFRETPEWAKARFFTHVDKSYYQIASDVRDMVKFSYLNLAENVFPSVQNNTNAMDLIFCRNVLMYFSKDVQSQVVNRLYRSLAEGGKLMVSPAEASVHRFAQFEKKYYEGVTFYTKPEGEPNLENAPALDAPSSVETFSKQMHTELYPTKRETYLTDTTAGRPEEKDAKQRKPTQPSAERKKPPIPAEVAGRKGSYNHAEFLYKQGNYQAAIDELMRCEPGVKTFSLITHSYANMGYFEHAYTWSKKLIAADRLIADSHYLQATILLELHREQDAAEALRRTTYLDQDFVMAYFTYGATLKKLGRHKEAHMAFKNCKWLLSKLPRDTEVPFSDGIPAGRLAEMIEMINREENGGA